MGVQELPESVFKLCQNTHPQGYQVERPSARQVFYPIHGDITDWFMQLKDPDNGITDVISICQEIGTINSILGSEPPALQTLSAALRRKNHSSPEGLEALFRSEEYAHLRETFCPDDDGWARQGLYNYRHTTEALLALLVPDTLSQPAGKDLAHRSQSKRFTQTSDIKYEADMKPKTA
ncbi:hypothetical protein GCM10023116_18860 [Kistimonas scapharcae]|uniref:Uncharacterized protein n=2 Tax=Kistimonas scapharcae TaxID=1036133 RepID=A0ABP8V2Z6_9GAMM